MLGFLKTLILQKQKVYSELCLKFQTMFFALKVVLFCFSRAAFKKLKDWYVAKHGQSGKKKYIIGLPLRKHVYAICSDFNGYKL